MKWWPQECRPGDMIRVRLGSVYHYGVYTGTEVIQFGTPPRPGRTAGELVVCATDLEGFSCGQIIETAVPDRKEKRLPREETVARARSRLGEGGYDLLHNNCEHFAYDCVFGVKLSTQEQEARRRWQQRPLLNVFVAELSRLEKPEKRPPNIRRFPGKTRKIQNAAAWKTLEYAVSRSYGCSMEQLKLRRSHGQWCCDRFFAAFAFAGQSVAVAVSNAPVSLRFGGAVKLPTGQSLEVKGASLDRLRVYQLRDGAAVPLETL